MAFADDGYGEGTGTLEEFFHHKPQEAQFDDPDWTPEFRKVMKDMAKDTDERDDAVERLCLELFADKSQLSRTDIVNVFWFDYGAKENRRARQRSKRKGLNLICVHPDDAIMALYKDGQPIAAFYASYRGVYQAGGYTFWNDGHYFASNMEGPRTAWSFKFVSAEEVKEVQKLTATEVTEGWWTMNDGRGGAFGPFESEGQAQEKADEMNKWLATLPPPLPNDTWVERIAGCSEIARDWLLNERSY